MGRLSEGAISGLLSIALLIIGLAPVMTLAQEDPQENRLESRIDFGNAYVNGQTIKSGAVYLMHRRKNTIESMLKLRQHYRQEILEDFATRERATLLSESDTDRRTTD